MSVTGRMMAPLALMALTCAGVTAHAEVVLSSNTEGGPEFVMPALETEPVDTVQVELDPMLERIQAEITDRYQGVEPVDGARIAALIDGSYLKDYEAVTLGGPVQFLNSPFISTGSAPAEPASVDLPPPAVKDSTGDLARFLNTPDGIRALSMMSGEQIEAVAQIMELIKNPEGAGSRSGDEALLAGIPDLNPGNLTSMRPEELLRMAMRKSPDPLMVGDGRDIYLKDWAAGQEADGSFYLVNAKLPGSHIPVAVGNIVGQFGEVLTTHVDSVQGSVVTFESGDKITERDLPDLDDGIPALSAENLIPGDNLSDEIIVSGPAPVRETLAAAEGGTPAMSAETVTPQDGDVKTVSAPSGKLQNGISPRPKARPDSLKETKK